MPQVVPARELSVGEVARINHWRNIVIISIIAIVFLSVFFISLRDFMPAQAVGIMFLLAFFLYSFINIRIGIFGVICAFLLSPEINMPFSNFRDFTLRLEDLLLIVLFLAWLGRVAMGLQKNLFIKTSLNLPISLVVMWNIFCSSRAILYSFVDTQYCIFTNLKIIQFFFIFFLIVNNLNNLKEVRLLFCALLITGLIIAIYAIFQIPTTEMFSANRLTAPFEGAAEPNTLGAFLTIILAISLCFFIYSEPSFLKKLSTLLVFILPFPIMYTFSRSAYYMSIAILVILAVISRRKWLILALIIFFAISRFILPGVVIERFFYNFKDARYYGFLDASAAERISAYNKTWYFIKNYTILGYGITAEGGIIDSQYARTIIETGLIGLGLFLFLILRLLLIGIRLFRSANAGWIKGVAASFIVTVIGMSVHCLGNVSFYIVRIAEPFWAFTGLVAYLLHYTNTQKGNPGLLVSNKA